MLSIGETHNKGPVTLTLWMESQKVKLIRWISKHKMVNMKFFHFNYLIHSHFELNVSQLSQKETDIFESKMEESYIFYKLHTAVAILAPFPPFWLIY